MSAGPKKRASGKGMADDLHARFIDSYLRLQFKKVFPRGVPDKIESGPPAKLSYNLTLEDDLARDQQINQSLKAVFGDAVRMRSHSIPEHNYRQTVFAISGLVPEIAAAALHRDPEGAREAVKMMDEEHPSWLTAWVEEAIASCAAIAEHVEGFQRGTDRPVKIGKPLKISPK